MGDDTESPKKRWQPFKRFDGRIEGWRGFLMETAVIGIGVLLALGAEQMVERWTWDRKVARAEEALRGEQESMYTLMAERSMTTPCVLAQLDRLREHILTDESERVPLEPTVDQLGSWVLRSPYRPMSDDVWQAANAEGTIGRMDYERQQLSALSYTLLEGFLNRQEQNFASGTELMILTEPVTLDQTTRLRLLQTISQHRSRVLLQEIVARQIMAVITRLDRAPEPEEVEAVLDQGSGTVAFCRENGYPLADWREDPAQAGAPVEIESE